MEKDTVLLIDTLKNILKNKKITYKVISEKLSLSEVTVKRIFSTYDCTLTRLASICKVAGINLMELAEISIQESKNKNYFLNEEQENYFTKNPYHFYIFKEFSRDKSFTQIMDEQNISQLFLEKILIKLDKLKMIELNSNNQVQIIAKGLIRPNLEGPFFNKIIKSQNHDFLEETYKDIRNEDCCFQSSEVSLSKSTYKEMIQEIHSLGKKYREKSYIESKTIPKKDLFSIRWLFAFLPYETDWTKYK